MANRLRLFQAMAGAKVGGAEAFFERFAAAVQRRGLAQRVAIRRDPDRAARLRAAAVDVVELGFRGPLDIATRIALTRELRAFAPSIVLGWMNRASTALPPRSLVRGARYVTVGRLGGYYDLKYYRRCDWLVGNTQDIRDYVVRAGWPASRAVYLPNFVDAVAAPPVDRATLDTPADAPVALALGRLHPNKAFDVLIAAATRLPALHLWIAGEGPLEAELRAAAAQGDLVGRVHFLGWRRDIAALLASADLLVCPSRHEPLGNVVIEAWAHGRPVVAAASEGPRQLVQDRQTGLLVPIDDADALAGAIRAVLADRGFADALAAAGRATYEAGYTEAAVVDRYLEFFARALEQR
ncbi:MAG: glycosyltransferase [Phreatobacter sp.]|uniref:glycosyltransferase n=1 Tax=Phreatobacter sp. TaxID=1966341 RepID=UPI001A4483DC|nr:glycosyltransferase [Phreatobacter sp.]MBL8571879.1 glycosyltransferase [Phreatobacter sp.]